MAYCVYIRAIGTYNPISIYGKHRLDCCWAIFHFAMRDDYIVAARYNGGDGLLVRISDLFLRRVPDTDTGPGAHYIADIVVADGAVASGLAVVQMVCENHDIPICDFRNTPVAPIRDIVKSILEKTPPRCAILLDTRDNELQQKVRNRISGKHCDLRYRRVIFCLTVDGTVAMPPPGIQIHVPGSLQDRMAVLLYHIPAHLRAQAESLDDFRPLAEAMLDYALFEPRIWQEVCVDGTLAEFLSTAMYQLVRRVRDDPGVDDGAYPSSPLASRLRDSLSSRSNAVCPSIHRVIPVGVSSADALQAMTVAIPKDLPDPYVVTVKASAVDDQCGSIAISQPLRYTVVNINCMINPGILVDVCRELRTGHRAVVSEVHAMNRKNDEKHDEMNRKQDETNQQLAETNQQLAAMRNEMATLVARLSNNDTSGVTGAAESHLTCSKTGCSNMVTTRFKSGKMQKQCAPCLSYFLKPNTKRKSCT
jgi:hypothetical protein